MGEKKGGKDKKKVSKRDPGAQSVLALRQEAEWSVSWEASKGQQGLEKGLGRQAPPKPGIALLEPIVGSQQIFTQGT